MAMSRHFPKELVGFIEVTYNVIPLVIGTAGEDGIELSIISEEINLTMNYYENCNDLTEEESQILWTLNQTLNVIRRVYERKQKEEQLNNEV